VNGRRGRVRGVVAALTSAVRDGGAPGPAHPGATEAHPGATEAHLGAAHDVASAPNASHHRAAVAHSNVKKILMNSDRS